MNITCRRVFSQCSVSSRCGTTQPTFPLIVMYNYDNYFELILYFSTKTVYLSLYYSVVSYLVNMSDRRKCYRTIQNLMLLFLFLIFHGSQTDTLKKRMLTKGTLPNTRLLASIISLFESFPKGFQK